MEKENTNENGISENANVHAAWVDELWDLRLICLEEN